MDWSPLLFLTDPVLRAPTLGCMLMCFSASIMGVFAFVRQRSLVGESLSHATYPGVILAALCIGLLLEPGDREAWAPVFILTGAFISALLGLWAIHSLETKLSISSDASLCLVLSIFFGVGITLASRVQFSHTRLYQQIQGYLYGQPATMTDVHIYLYLGLSLLTLLVVLLLFKELQVVHFNPDYAKTLGVNVRSIDAITFVLLVLAVVIGIRSVGVVLMSAMLIAPAAAARQYSDRLPVVLAIAAFFGLLSGFLGNYLSVVISQGVVRWYQIDRLSLPTGPMIVLVASTLCILSLLFAPRRGVILRAWRAMAFRRRCFEENLLKAIWRWGEKDGLSFSQCQQFQPLWSPFLKRILRKLEQKGFTSLKEGRYLLTEAGSQEAQRVVRLHRLWELYLVDYLGMGVEKVHKSAEEMEHVLTPEIEEQLTEMLKNPLFDPHNQPIPQVSRPSQGEV